MRFLKHGWLIILFGAVLAYGARQGIGSVDRVNSIKPQWFSAGTFTGTPAKDPLSTTKNKQAYHLCGTLDYDFPSLTGPAALSITCAESTALTIAGCTFNDRVTLGVDQARASAFGQIDVYQATATTFKVVACANGITDAGSFNQPDSGYTICCDGY